MTPTEIASDYTAILDCIRPDIYPREPISPRDLLRYLTALEGQRPKGGRLMRTARAAELSRRLDAGEPLI